MRRFGLAMLAGAAGCLLLPMAASAKDVSSVVLCGDSGCRKVDRNQRFLNLFNTAAVPAHRPPRAERQRWFRVRVRMDEPGAPDVWHTRYYPDAGRTWDAGDRWMQLSARSRRAFDSATAGMTAFGSSPAAPPRQETATRPEKPGTHVALAAMIVVTVAMILAATAAARRIARRAA